MLTRTEGKFARFQFDSLAELSRYVADNPRTWRLEYSATTRASATWDLGAGYKGAVDLARDGWLEGAQRAQEALQALQLATPAPVTRNDFYGHLPHVPRYCAGAPDSMIRYARDATSGSARVLTLYVPVTANAVVDAKFMANFGLGVAQYINQLETDGTRVELHAVIASALRSGWRCTWAIKLKDAEQPLDLAVTSFALGHPAMLRRLGFALIERSPAPTEGGYGKAGSVSLTSLIEPPVGAYVLNGMNRAAQVARTPEQATAYVAEQIERMASEADASSEGL